MENGANPNLKIGCNGRLASVLGKFENCAYTTVMHIAASSEESEYLDVALSHGGSPDILDGNQFPLSLSAFLSENEEVIDVMFKHGFNQNIMIIGMLDGTLLHNLLFREAIEAALMLVEKGDALDFSLVNERGMNYLQTINFVSEDISKWDHDKFAKLEAIIRLKMSNGVVRGSEF